MIASLETIAGRALSSLHTVRASYDIARMAIERGVPGDFVECGVFAGANAAAMAKAILDQVELRCSRIVRATGGIVSRRPRVHLFDSFEGIPQAGPHDTEFLEYGHKPGLSTCSLEAVKTHMQEWGIPEELLVYHPGWFADTTPERSYSWNRNGIEGIAVLRLDGDLYESTKVCLEHLLPLVSPGGWVIVDDFDLSGARKAVMEIAGGQMGPTYFQRHG